MKISLLNLEKQKTRFKDRLIYPVEFHISKSARDKYDFDEIVFTANGNVIFHNLHAARIFAQKMNQHRDLINHPEKAVSAADLNAMGLIDEILHYVILLYRMEVRPEVLQNAQQWLEEEIGAGELNKILHQFVTEFPPVEVSQNKTDVSSYLESATEDVPNRLIALEEMLMLWLANRNEAFEPYNELFDETALKSKTEYAKTLDQLHKFFDTQPPFGPEKQNLIDLLLMPGKENPKSLRGQLLFILDNWGMILESDLLKRLLGDRLDIGRRLLMSLDFIEEEDRIRFVGFGPGPSYVPEFGELDEEPERFSPDIHWMPRVVLIAKSTLVWLDQLSKKYQRSVNRLDQIPDEELDKLANWGITGLWLIGLWQRSKASKQIKQLCGNPEAESSAYSLYDYNMSDDLGGEEAYRNLRDRCWQRGIRLASDMVPNHMAIDSRWVVEHPEWFIQLDYPPFPSYTFNGPNLSNHPDIGIFIEDHYYDRTDAAVVFKRVNFKTGETRYIYHGNDGTSFPWNDTAQLNFLNPDTREAVIQTILHVARMFPIIRFDAAMTLAKRHFQRLWFPEPGKGGDIPSRAQFGLTKSQFNELIPVEFWREVVDRVAQEAPDTLLLAEAFWMMEGYFVRTLGMHRVYNSAFMNMLKNEDNKNYRYTVKNTLEYNPEILKRYVNFMNNPDEETAIAQFGDGDKYFGVCTLMATMPGLPMFGHGQIEGFREKYGMEYRRAYHEEQENHYLIERHYREIFPLLKKRYVFAEVDNFVFYDFFTPNGDVDENVFAYSNRFHGERALVVYHNVYGHTWGWIKNSVAYTQKKENGEQTLVQKTIGEGLDLPNDGSYYCIFRDYSNNLEYIRNCREIWDNGVYLELSAYRCHVFMDFRIVQDNEWQHYAQLNASLEGRGTPSIQEALREVYLKPLHFYFKALLDPKMVERIISVQKVPDKRKEFLMEFEEKYDELLNECKKFGSTDGDKNPLVDSALKELEASLKLHQLGKLYQLPKSRKYKWAIEFMNEGNEFESAFWSLLFSWIVVHKVGGMFSEKELNFRSRSLIDEWLIGKLIYHLSLDVGMHDSQANHSAALVKLITTHQNWISIDAPKSKRENHLLHHLLNDREVQSFLQMNRYEGIVYFNKEAFEMLAWWLFIIAVIDSVKSGKKGAVAKEIADRYGIIRKWLKAMETSEFQVEKLLEKLKGTKRKKK